MITKTFHIDCIEYMKTIPDRFFDLAVVDPPYGINYAEEAGKKSGTQFGKAAAKKSNYSIKDWDKNIPNRSYFVELFRISKNQVIWGANHFTKYLPNSSGWIFWDKNNGSNDFSDGELAFTSFNKGLRKVKVTCNGMIQDNMKYKEIRIHPTQKPIPLYKWIFANYAKKGDKIFDSHLGSQNSRIAAWDLELDFWGCELDKDYFKSGNESFKNHKNQPKGLFKENEVARYKLKSLL